MEDSVRFQSANDNHRFYQRRLADGSTMANDMVEVTTLRGPAGHARVYLIECAEPFPERRDIG